MANPRPRKSAFFPATKASSVSPAAVELHSLAHYLATAEQSNKFFSEKARFEQMLRLPLERGDDPLIKQALKIAAKAQDGGTVKYLQNAMHQAAQTVEIAADGAAPSYAKLFVVPVVLIEAPGLTDGKVGWEEPLAQMAQAFHTTGVLAYGEDVKVINYLYHPDELGELPPSGMLRLARQIVSAGGRGEKVAGPEALAQTGWSPVRPSPDDAQMSTGHIRFLLGVVTGTDKDRDPFKPRKDGRGSEESGAGEQWRALAKAALTAAAGNAGDCPALVVGEPGLFYDTFVISLIFNKIALVEAQSEVILEDTDYDDVVAVIALYQDEDNADRREAGISFITKSENRLLGAAFVEVFRHEVGEGIVHLLGHVAENLGVASGTLVETVIPLRHCNGCGTTLCLGPDEDGDLTLVHPDTDDEDGLDMALDGGGETLGVTLFEALADISGTPIAASWPDDDDDMVMTDADAVLEAVEKVAFSEDPAKTVAKRKKLHKLVAKHLKAGRDIVIEEALVQAADELDYDTVFELDAAAQRYAQECAVTVGRGMGEAAGILVAIPVIFSDVRNLAVDIHPSKDFGKFKSSLASAVGLEATQHLYLQERLYSPAELSLLKWSHLGVLTKQLTKIAGGAPAKAPLVVQPSALVEAELRSEEPVPGLRFIIGVALHAPDEDPPEIFPLSPNDAPRWMARITKWQAAAEKTLTEALGGAKVTGPLKVLAAQEYFSAVMQSLPDFKEFSVKQQLAGILTATGIDPKNIEAVLATYADEDDEDAPLRSVATLTSKLDNSSLGALTLDVGGFEDSDDTQGLVYVALEDAGVKNVRSIDEILPLTKCAGCGGPLYLVPTQGEEGFALGHTGEEAPHPPTLH